MKAQRSLTLALLILITSAASTFAQGVSFTPVKTDRWQIGIKVECPGSCTGIVTTLPVPMNWPEQKVKIVATDKSSHVSSIRYPKPLSGSAQQMVISIPRVAAGQTAHALVTFEIEKSSIINPKGQDSMKAPSRLSRTLRQYLLESPYIESKNPKIQKLAKDVVAGKQSDWDKVEAIFDWVRENVKYKFDVQIKGALKALQDGHGDCEELTSLFIAMCRVNEIPARSVWIPGHCYPEFYLEDAKGKGHWFPCQAAGARAFGEMREARPILQKGDSFRITGERRPQRYVKPTFRAKNATANPRVQFIQKAVK